MASISGTEAQWIKCSLFLMVICFISEMISKCLLHSVHSVLVPKYGLDIQDLATGFNVPFIVQELTNVKLHDFLFTILKFYY